MGVLSIIIGALTVVTPVFHYLSSQATPIESIDAEIAELKERIAALEARKAEMT